MKMAKTILLGTAAALVGTVGASAADLRAAPPVQFVQVCDAAGAGFWVIPGTDVCVSINGTVSMGLLVQSNNNVVNSYNQMGVQNLRLNPFFGAPGTAGVVGQNPAASTILFGNGRIQTRSFQRTDIGIIRTTINIQGDTALVGDINVGLRQAWVSVTNAAGVFTAGLTETFFAPAAGIGTGSGVSNSAASFTSGLGFSNGTLLGNEQGARRVAFAYTAVLAPNATATIAIEQNVGLNTQGGGGILAGTSGAVASGQVLPALVGNVMLGTAASGNFIALSGAVTNNRAFTGNAVGTGATTGTTGYAVAVTAGLNADVISRGSRFGVRFAYADGASQYLGNGIAQSAWMTGATAGLGGMTPGTMRNIAGWAANAAYTHQWNPQWRTALYAGVTAMSYRGNAAMAAANITGGNIFTNNGTPSFLNVGVGAGSVNNNSLVGWNVTNLARSAWQAGTTTMWTPVSGFSVALDVAVMQGRYINTFGGNGSGLGSVRTGWTTTLGVRRDF